MRHWRKFDIRPRLLPEPERDWKRINVEPSPPCSLVTCAMKLAVMDPANRDGELVAHSASECTWLRKGEVMRIRRHAAAHQTGLPQHELPVVLIAQANRFAQSTGLHLRRDRFPAPAAAFWLATASAGRQISALVRDSMSGIVRSAREHRRRPPEFVR